MLNLFIFAYRPFVLIVKIVLLIIKPLLSVKLQAWIALRNNNQISFQNDSRPVFLFHASSGEIEYVKSLIRELKQAGAQITVVVSYSSPSAERLFANIKNDVDLFIPLPWDQPSPIKFFLDKINPHSVFFARTDLWPELIFQLNKRRTRTYIIAYNPSLTWKNQLAVKSLLRQFNALFCVHPQQPEMLRPLLPSAVHLASVGDTRFDQVFWRLQQPSKIDFENAVKYCVFGSTWDQDEQIILSQISKIIDLGYKIIWCPHEIDDKHVDRLIHHEELKLYRLQRFSNLDFTGKIDLTEIDVLIVDRIGYLADLYRNAAWAFVGGSYKGKVHSVMEPLCCAIPVIVGPHIQNNPEALKYERITMNDLKVVQVTHNSLQFFEAVQKIEAASLNNFKKLLIGNLEQNRYATKKILNYIISKTQESLNS